MLFTISLSPFLKSFIFSSFVPSPSVFLFLIYMYIIFSVPFALSSISPDFFSTHCFSTHFFLLSISLSHSIIVGMLIKMSVWWHLVLPSLLPHIHHPHSHWPASQPGSQQVIALPSEALSLLLAAPWNTDYAQSVLPSPGSVSHLSKQTEGAQLPWKWGTLASGGA